MASFIIGMAGHIDHGKTSLVHALTGVVTDTLKEEKERGITIDIGFAHWERGITFIDVPGHERFIHNMTAGVHAIDYALLVIAADDGVMPQTREHLDILRWLGVKSGAVVITKIDLVNGSVISELTQSVRKLTKGVFPDDHPVYSVSVKHSIGIEDLKKHLIALPDKKEISICPQTFRMFVDRVFVKPGFGTIVTGTVRAGEIRLQSEVLIYPELIGARVRGIQKRFQDDATASAGDRAAINLSFNRAVEIRRGAVLAEPGCYQTNHLYYAAMTFGRSIKPHAALRMLTGTAELFARVMPIHGLPWPEQTGYVLIRVEMPLPLAPGDRFILREKNATGTVGGGIIAWPADPVLVHFSAESKNKFFQAATTNDYPSVVRHWLNETGYFHTDHLARILGVKSEWLGDLADSLSFHRAGYDQRWIIHQPWFDETLEQVLARVDDYHRQHPAESGIPMTVLSQHFFEHLPQPLLEIVLEALRKKNAIGQTGDRIFRYGYMAKTDPPEQAISDYIEQRLKKDFFQPTSVTELATKGGYSEKEIIRALQRMVREDRVIHTGDQIYFHSETVCRAISILVDFLKNNPHITIQDFKTLTGTSRKYALALLEYFDRQQITKRKGDFRSLSGNLSDAEIK